MMYRVYSVMPIVLDIPDDDLRAFEAHKKAYEEAMAKNAVEDPMEEFREFIARQGRRPSVPPQCSVYRPPVE